MSTATTAAPIAVADRVRRKDARMDCGVGIVDEVTPEEGDWPLGCYVVWPPHDAVYLGLAGRHRSWIAASALIRVGGAREAVSS